MAKKISNLGFRKFTCPVDGVEWDAYESKYRNFSPIVRAYFKTFGLGKGARFALLAKLSHRVEGENNSKISYDGFLGVKYFFHITSLNPSLRELIPLFETMHHNGQSEKLSGLITNYRGSHYVIPMGGNYTERDGKYYYLDGKEVPELFPQYPKGLRYLLNVVASPYLVINFFAKLLAFVAVYLDDKWTELYFRKVKNVMMNNELLAPIWNGTLRITFALIGLILGIIRVAVTSAASPLHYLFFKESHETKSLGATIASVAATLGTFIGLAFSPGGFEPFAASIAAAAFPHAMVVTLGVIVAAYISFAIGSLTNQLWEHMKGQGRAISIEVGGKEYEDFVPLQKRQNKREGQKQMIEMQPLDNQTIDNDADTSEDEEEAAGVLVGYKTNIPKSKSAPFEFYSASNNNKESSLLPKSATFS